MVGLLGVYPGLQGLIKKLANWSSSGGALLRLMEGPEGQLEATGGALEVGLRRGSCSPFRIWVLAARQRT